MNAAVMTYSDSAAYSPPKLGGDALAQRGLGRSVQRRAVPINKVRFASIVRWLRVFEQTTPALRATPPY